MTKEKDRPLRDIITILGIVFGVLALLLGTPLFLILQPGGSGVLASLRLADGSEYMVTQVCNWSPEPYKHCLWLWQPGTQNQEISGQKKNLSNFI
jgi:hypothetical protein